MNPKTVGNNIRKYRELRHWTQEELAMAAGVDARTVQRAESGHALALESLRAIANAFETPIEALSASPEGLEAKIAEFRRKYSVIDLNLVERSNLCDLFGADALWFQRRGTLTDKQADAIAEFEQHVKDWGDIWRDLEPIQKREAEKHLEQVLDQLVSLKLTVSAGSETMTLRGDADSKPFYLSVLYVAVVPGSMPLRALIREKNVPMQFA